MDQIRLKTEEDFNSDDSNDEVIESIAKEFGVKRNGWLYMDKKAKEEKRRQKEIIKGDPSIVSLRVVWNVSMRLEMNNAIYSSYPIVLPPVWNVSMGLEMNNAISSSYPIVLPPLLQRKLSRKERREASQIERERERETARSNGTRVLHHDPYRDSRRSPTYEAYSRSKRSRSRSRSYAPSQSRRVSRGVNADDNHRSKDNGPKIEYITEFGGAGDGDEPKREGYFPPLSPPSFPA